MDLRLEFPPHALREYAFIADGERGALIGPRGDLCWMCAPSWHAEAVFSTLLGGQGCYAITPSGRSTWGGYYDQRSLIWNSRWITADGIVECREALARPATRQVATVLRHIRVLEGQVRLRLVLDLRARFGAEAMVHCRRDTNGTWTGRSGPLHLRWSGAGDCHRAGSGPLIGETTLIEGDERHLVLEIGTAPLAGPPPQPGPAWSATEREWASIIEPIRTPVVGQRDAEQALAVLSGMTSETGGMVAAATTSLPERADEGRNYDYRYVWIRDQAYAGLAAAAHGHSRLVDVAVRFITERLVDHGPHLRPAYTVDGATVPNQRHVTTLEGYPGGADRTGNWVNRQFQLDAFGETLELYAAASRLGRLDTQHWSAIDTTTSAIALRWTEPDAGIWELDPQRWAHSRLACVAGLRAVSAEAPAARRRPWLDLADRILAEVRRDCLRSGRWQRAPHDPRVDACLLVPFARGLLDPNGPEARATVDAIEVELGGDGYLYRFRHDDRPLAQAEGAFLLCGFLLSMVRARQGRVVEARALFERNRAAAGSPGLLAEEFDIDQRQLRGNLPQAFVHALLLEASAIVTTDSDDRPELRAHVENNLRT